MKGKKKSKSKITMLFVLLIIGGIFAVLASSKLIRVQVNSDTIEESAEVSNYFDTTQSSAIFSLNDVKNNKQKNAVLFTASWCGSCSKLIDDLKKEAGEYKNMNTYILDLETYRDTANELNVPITPTLVILENGKQKNYPEIAINDLPAVINDFNRIGIR